MQGLRLKEVHFHFMISLNLQLLSFGLLFNSFTRAGDQIAIVSN